MGHNPRGPVSRRSSLVERDSDVLRRVRPATKFPDERILRPIAKGFEHCIYRLGHGENASVIIWFCQNRLRCRHVTFLSRAVRQQHHPKSGRRTPTYRPNLPSSSRALTPHSRSFRRGVLCRKGSSPDPCRKSLPCNRGAAVIHSGWPKPELWFLPLLRKTVLTA